MSPCWAPRWVGSMDDEYFFKTMSAKKSGQKRRHVSDEDLTTPNTQNWPRFLVIERLDGDFENTSRILIHRNIVGMAGEPKTLKKIAPTKYLVETQKSVHTELLLELTRISDIRVRITPHRNLNTIKGIVKHPELKNSIEKEILEELGSIAKEVKKIRVTREGKLQPTGTHIVTFDSSTLPESVKIACLNIPVEPYIPNPLRCYNCQKYGHSKTKCTKKPICPKCGDDGHQEANCTSPQKCVNCQGAHPAYSRQCPRWQMEKEVQILHYTKNLPFPEARKAVEAKSASTPRGTYSHVVSSTMPVKSTASIATQTEISFPPTQTDISFPPPSTRASKKHIPKSHASNTEPTSIEPTSTQNESQSKISNTSTSQSQKSKLPKAVNKSSTNNNKHAKKVIAECHSKPSSAMETDHGSQKGNALEEHNRFTPLVAYTDAFEDSMETECVSQSKGKKHQTRPPAD